MQLVQNKIFNSTLGEWPHTHLDTSSSLPQMIWFVVDFVRCLWVKQFDWSAPDDVIARAWWCHALWLAQEVLSQHLARDKVLSRSTWAGNAQVQHMSTAESTLDQVCVKIVHELIWPKYLSRRFVKLSFLFGSSRIGLIASPSQLLQLPYCHPAERQPDTRWLAGPFGSSPHHQLLPQGPANHLVSGCLSLGWQCRSCSSCSGRAINPLLMNHTWIIVILPVWYTWVRLHSAEIGKESLTKVFFREQTE